MNTITLPEQEKEFARQTVDRFVRRFEASYRLLAYHAALPLLLTPELLNYLRNQFLRGQVPWVAEVDLLLSDLCSPVGYELYAMDTAVRSVLIEEMKQELGEQRMQDVARLLITYVRQLANTNPFFGQQELQSQQWAAMVYLDEQRETAVRQIAQAFQNVRGSDRTHMAQLAKITEEISAQLSAYPNLVDFAKVVSDYVIDPSAVDRQALEREYQVLGVKLSVEPLLVPPLQIFEFDVATVEVERSGLFGRGNKLTITRRRHQAQYFSEDLGNQVGLEMVAIPGGTFIMGAPETEAESTSDERPQHQVTVNPFFMGKYPITQAQWQAVAALEQINRELNPDPSNFKGSDRPVEQVSWYDVVEFCDRLAKATRRDYRLPSEAEWEYACRAGTNTPFHFGETITTDLANYDGTDDKENKWSGSYGRGPKGIYRQETTPAGSFQVANGFGLYDMHGNVWEWCADKWHENYQGAPSNGSGWISKPDEEYRLLRGGSWNDNPRNCRSACRNWFGPGIRNYNIGFRVVVSGARTA